MSLERQLARIFAAAIAAITFCLAPSLADAHAGHVHAGTVWATPVADDLDQLVNQPAASPVSAAETKTAEARPTNTFAQPGCDGRSCCTGMVCWAIALAPAEPSFVAPIMPSLLSIPEPSDRWSFDPDGLRKPPKSFA